MVIYDKNQLTFNIIFVIILVSSITMNLLFALNFQKFDENFLNVSRRLENIESNQNYNFIQGSHMEIDYQMTPQGLFIESASDFGKLTGPSMQPSVFDGNTVIEQKYQGGSVEEGTIIRYLRDDGTAVIHRVRADYGDEVFVQGDALKENEIISKDKITHIVIGVLFT